MVCSKATREIDSTVEHIQLRREMSGNIASALRGVALHFGDGRQLVDKLSSHCASYRKIAAEL